MNSHLATNNVLDVDDGESEGQSRSPLVELPKVDSALVSGRPTSALHFLFALLQPSLLFQVCSNDCLSDESLPL